MDKFLQVIYLFLYFYHIILNRKYKRNYKNHIENNYLKLVSNYHYKKNQILKFNKIKLNYNKNKEIIMY